MHEEFEAPGTINDWIIKNKYTVSFTKIYKYENLPKEIKEIDFLIILGGPQSPETTKDEYPYFDSRKEIEFIRKCICENKAVMGICLGAQLIGESLGAKYEHSPEKEIGKFSIYLTPDGLNNKKIKNFGKTIEVGHWHNDMPGLTKDARILAYSNGCPRQIIEYSKLVYGFQCHLELNIDVVKMLIDNSEYEFKRPHKYVQSPKQLIENDYSEMNNILHEFLDSLVDEYKSINRKI